MRDKMILVLFFLLGAVFSMVVMGLTKDKYEPIFETGGKIKFSSDIYDTECYELLKVRKGSLFGVALKKCTQTVTSDAREGK